MDRNDLQVDRRTLLRATSFLASIPADVGVVWASASGGDASAAPGDGSGAVPAPVDGAAGLASSATRRLEGYAYGGAPVVADPAATGDAAPAVRSDDASGDDPQGYGEYGYGGSVS